MRDLARPHETLLVADALTGQDAVSTAKAFHERLPLTGLVLTRADGDARGGAALSMRARHRPADQVPRRGREDRGLEAFDPERVAGRILGMGDVVALVEKAAESIDQRQGREAGQEAAKGSFDLEDMRRQLQQMRKMGGMEGILGKLPGVQKIKKQLAEANIDDKIIDRQ